MTIIQCECCLTNNENLRSLAYYQKKKGVNEPQADKLVLQADLYVRHKSFRTTNETPIRMSSFENSRSRACLSLPCPPK